MVSRGQFLCSHAQSAREPAASPPEQILGLTSLCSLLSHHLTMALSDRGSLDHVSAPSWHGVLGKQVMVRWEGRTYDVGNCRPWGGRRWPRGCQVAARLTAGSQTHCRVGFLSEIVFICGMQPLSSETHPGWLSCLSERVWRSHSSWSLVGRAPGPGLGCKRQPRTVLSWHCRVTLVIPGSWALLWALVACGELLGAGWKQPDGGGFLHRRGVSGCICRECLHWVALLGLFLEALASVRVCVPESSYLPWTGVKI